ncbi:MAG: ABC transporter permease [Bacillota bacterium]|nr:ABC transporter permease [Bacillota bacterium]
MKISDLLAMCFRNLFRRKVRTVLTVLGVVIGTCSIVVMMSLGVGLNRSLDEEIASYMDITAIDVTVPEGEHSNKKDVALDDRCVEQMRRLDHVKTVSPALILNGVAEISSGNYTFSDSITAIDLSQMKDMGYEVKEGALPEQDQDNVILWGSWTPWQFSDANTGEIPSYSMDDNGEYTSPAAVDAMGGQYSISVIRQNTAAAGNSDGTTDGGGEGQSGTSDGRKETVSSQPIYPIGWLKEDWSRYESVYGACISLELGKKLLAEYNAINGIQSDKSLYSNVQVIVDNYENVEAVEQSIKDMGYQTSSALEFREAMSKQARLIQLILGGLGAISLFVAALGITNTMIMSIYERTREIGVMKVLGCRLNDIRMMFLLEAGGIGFLGGAVGILFSYFLSFVLNAVTAMLSSEDMMIGKISVIPFWLVLLGMGFAIGVGLIAGFSPANRAVKISPLAAIRQE